ncbi:MAG: GxxExxY protein [Methylococcaceae bacterium]|jgi:GxxExxY protein|nr:GxxExxY protein [Methylococcaceae bacterium]MDD1642629.1 GxxExxY protein [Methylococcaceae bacterium]
MHNGKKQSTKTTKGTKKMDGEIWHSEECCEIQGALFEVYREMGCGFLEAVYQECLEKGLFKRGMPFVAHQVLRLFYKGGDIEANLYP